MSKSNKTADNLREVITELFWMAQRYANGRSTYAPDDYNKAIDVAIKNGWKVPQKFAHMPLYADDGLLGKWMPEAQRFEGEFVKKNDKRRDSKR